MNYAIELRKHSGNHPKIFVYKIYEFPFIWNSCLLLNKNIPSSAILSLGLHPKKKKKKWYDFAKYNEEC